MPKNKEAKTTNHVHHDASPPLVSTTAVEVVPVISPIMETLSLHNTTATTNIRNECYVWGNHTKQDPEQIISAIYNEIVYWRKNLFLLPSGKSGKYFISEGIRLINSWNNDSTELKTCSFKAYDYASSSARETQFRIQKQTKLCMS